MALTKGLYIVATPIGNLGDITLRALETLKACNTIACEDTRVSRKLLSAYGIDKPLMSYHDHNAAQTRPLIREKISQGQAIALISDAGTPLISDPGYKLLQDCRAAGLPITFLPGPSATIAGLVLSGMPTDRFLFAGFADPKTYPELGSLKMTLVFFESAQRLPATLKDMSLIFSNRTVAIVREITKLFEDVRQGSFEDIISFYEKEGTPKGEVVLVLSPPVTEGVTDTDIDHLLRQALETQSLRDACTLVAGTLGVPRKQVYQRALVMTKIAPPVA